MDISNLQTKSTYIRHRNGKIKTAVQSKAQIVTKLTLIILAFLTIYGFKTFDYKNISVVAAMGETLNNIKQMFLGAKLSHFNLQYGFYQVLVTLSLGFLTTLIGAVIALFLGIFAARNLSNRATSNIIKAVVSFIRAIPTVLWVLIFAVAAGLGSVAAVIGLTFHTVGYLIKAYSESFEEMDEGVIEALKASGASFWQIIFQAVLPSTATSLMAWTFLRFEINFTNAVAMGAAAGAGGIGFELFMAGGFYYDLREVGVITMLILTVAMFLEFSSTKIKNKYIK